MIFESCLDLCVECSISSCLICLYLVQFLIVCENFKHQIPSGVIKQCYPLQHLQGDVHGKITELNGNFSTSDV